MTENQKQTTTVPASESMNHQTANPLWGGRFATGPSAIMQEINQSIGFDQRLWQQDIAASQAHALMLRQQGIISQTDFEAIDQGLVQIKNEIAAGEFEFKASHEDIHMNIEARLAELIGGAAGRLHTARSRNDQVTTDFRLWLREAIDGLDIEIERLQAALIDQATQHLDTILPGLTHMQAAQPISFAHQLLAYVEMLGRDRGRLQDGKVRLNENPLGSAALAGTPYPIDRDFTSQRLGFSRPTANSLDAVSDRDFALEFLGHATILGVHLSRLAEEIIIWMSDPFRFIKLSDRFTTGSSIMPQKRNPDAAELVRARTGRNLAAFVNLVMVIKALPLAYAKDMQEDKEPVFATVDSLSLCLNAMTGMVGDLVVNKERMRQAAESGFLTATDLADYLVLELGLPFRTAHEITGKIVALAESKSTTLNKLPLSEMQKFESKITAVVYSWLTVEASMARRTSFGGTAPIRVKEAITVAREKFLKTAPD